MDARSTRDAGAHVVTTAPLAAAACAWATERVHLTVAAPGKTGWDDALATAAGLIVRTDTAVDASLLDAAPELHVVGRAGAGLDTVDLAACRSRGVHVVYTPEANTQAVVEYVFRLLLERLRPVHELSGAVERDMWDALRRRTAGERELAELTVGVLGFGRIGRRVGAVASAFGARVLYHDLVAIPPPARGDAEPVPLDALLAESDVLTIHVDGRPSNRGFLNAARLGRLKDDVLLINTSRGFIVDSRSLAEWIRTRPAASALLDVHDPEPFGPEHPLLGLANVRLLPHLASRTRKAMEHMSWVVRDVVAVLEGRAPRWPAPRA